MYPHVNLVPPVTPVITGTSKTPMTPVTPGTISTPVTVLTPVTISTTVTSVTPANCALLSGCSGQGKCLTDNTCKCNEGFTGDDCSGNSFHYLN